jgi:hypothetical protein
MISCGLDLQQAVDPRFDQLHQHGAMQRQQLQFVAK